MPFLEVWDLMRRGLMPVARQILERFKFYRERDLERPADDEPLSDEEEAELRPIISCLTRAAVRSQEMKLGSLISTLARLHKKPELYRTGVLPAAVLWELAQDYQRGAEPHGTFSMDIWGSDQTALSYDRVDPSEEAIAAAAARAAARIQEARLPGRPDLPANKELAEGLAAAFGKSELKISRSLSFVDGKEGVRHAEGGDFFDFLELILPPLREFLRERRLPPVTTESIVRAARGYIAESLAAHPPSTPDYSHGSDDDIFGEDLQG